MCIKNKLVQYSFRLDIFYYASSIYFGIRMPHRMWFLLKGNSVKKRVPVVKKEKKLPHQRSVNVFMSLGLKNIKGVGKHLLRHNVYHADDLSTLEEPMEIIILDGNKMPSFAQLCDVGKGAEIFVLSTKKKVSAELAELIRKLCGTLNICVVLVTEVASVISSALWRHSTRLSA